MTRNLEGARIQIRAQIYMDTHEGPFRGHEYIAWINRMDRLYREDRGIPKDSPTADQADFTAFIIETTGWMEEEAE